jgi:hypothetical protein
MRADLTDSDGDTPESMAIALAEWSKRRAWRHPQSGSVAANPDCQVTSVRLKRMLGRGHPNVAYTEGLSLGSVHVNRHAKSNPMGEASARARSALGE